MENFDRMLRCVTHLIYLLVDTAETEVQELEVQRLIRNLVAGRPRSAMYGDTLLHLCSSRLNTCASSSGQSPQGVRSVKYQNNLI